MTTRNCSSVSHDQSRRSSLAEFLARSGRKRVRDAKLEVKKEKLVVSHLIPLCSLEPVFTSCLTGTSLAILSHKAILPLSPCLAQVPCR